MKKQTIYNTLKVLAVIAVLAGWIGYVRLYNPQTGSYTPSVDSAAIETAPDVQGIFTDINNERVKLGLAPLTLDQRLVESANAKCNDMVLNHYWAHDTPTGQTPWSFIGQFDKSFKYGGENLAKGYDDDEILVKGWMNSPGHRANIVNTHYNLVGYAVCYSDDFHYMVVQHLADI